MMWNPTDRPLELSHNINKSSGNGKSLKEQNNQTHLEENQMTNQRKLCPTTQQNSPIYARKGNIVSVIKVGSSERMYKKAEKLYRLWYHRNFLMPLSLGVQWRKWKLLYMSQGFPGDSDGSLPAMQDTWVWSLGWEDPLEKEMATHSSILAWKILWTEEPGGWNPWGQKELDSWETSFSFFSS